MWDRERILGAAGLALLLTLAFLTGLAPRAVLIPAVAVAGLLAAGWLLLRMRRS